MNRLTVTTAAAAVCLALIALVARHPALGSEPGHTTKNYGEAGGDVWTIEGRLHVESGGTVHAKSGSSTVIAGTLSVGGTTTVTGAVTVGSGGSITTASGATQTIASGAVLAVGGKLTLPVATVSTTTTLTAAMSGQDIVNTAEDITLTLPTAAAGLRYAFHVGAIAGATGLVIHPPSPAKVHGNGLTATTAKGLKCTHATARDGDFVSIHCDGTDWWIDAINGTWAQEP